MAIGSVSRMHLFCERTTPSVDICLKLDFGIIFDS